MKKAIRSFVSFTRTERIGLVALCAIILILLSIRITMHVWVRPANDTANERKLTAAWEAFKRSQPAIHDTTIVAITDSINLNTADSATLVLLKGIGPATARRIVAWRIKNGKFTNISQLSETGSFSHETLEMLKKHLAINKPN